MLFLSLVLCAATGIAWAVCAKARRGKSGSTRSGMLVGYALLFLPAMVLAKSNSPADVSEFFGGVLALNLIFWIVVTLWDLPRAPLRNE